MRSRLKLGAREKTAARKVFLLKMTLDAQPVFCTLHQEYWMLDGFQFEDGQPTGARRGQNVQDPVFTKTVPSTPAIRWAALTEIL